MLKSFLEANQLKDLTVAIQVKVATCGNHLNDIPVAM